MHPKYLQIRRSQIDPPAPVNGGLRWRRYLTDAAEAWFGRLDQPPSEPPQTQQPARPQAAESVLAPRIVSTPPGEGRAGEEYIYQAKACHSMVGDFTWSLRKGPPGMKVDRHSGLVTWTPEDGGHVDIVLHAHCLYGTGTDQSWSVCVRKAQAVRAATPAPRFRQALRRKSEHVARKPRDPLPRLPLPWREPVRRTGAPRQTAAPPTGRFGAAVVPLRI